MDDFDQEVSLKAKRDIARKTVDLFFDSIKSSLKDGDRVVIRGFGRFNVKDCGGYIGRNPKTGEKIEVRPKKRPVFQPGKPMRAVVDGRK
jgi:integration host factor subunit beta